MSVLVVQICSYGVVRRHVSCQSSLSKSVLTALSDVMSHVNPRGPHLFLRACQTSCLMSVLVVHICSYGPVRRHVSCQSSWSISVLTGLLGVMTYVSPRGPHLFLRRCQTSCLNSVLVVQICSYGPVRRHVSSPEIVVRRYRFTSSLVKCLKAVGWRPLGIRLQVYHPGQSCFWN
ncbi:hypothetical protein RRG08_061790 [Elysia crispata]|uniref:Uncharacterized protein n=1 Tax=Elysia crispata TaxID=231223 RepID=A0AAE0Y6A5_9GAST|nr:hypothetical protein RRG08_061790 [Elysia crispata]